MNDEREMGADGAGQLARLVLHVSDEIIAYVQGKITAIGGDELEIPCVSTAKLMSEKLIVRTLEDNYDIVAQSINRSITTALGGYWCNDRELNPQENLAGYMSCLVDHFLAKCVATIDKEFREIDEFNQCVVRNADGSIKRHKNGDLMLKTDAA